MSPFSIGSSERSPSSTAWRRSTVIRFPDRHDGRCPSCEAKRWAYDAVLGPWRVRRELLALDIDRSPPEFASARGPPSLW